MSRLVWICALLTCLAWADDPPRAADQREYELAVAAGKETDGPRQLEILLTWSQEYPHTSLEAARRRLFLAAYQRTGQIREAVAAAQGVLANDPKDLGALLALVNLSPQTTDPTPQSTQRALDAAHLLLNKVIEKSFADERRPAAIEAERWRAARTEADESARYCQAWALLEADEASEAEAALTNLLVRHPGSARSSYLLAQAILGQSDPNKHELALYSLARAAAHDGPGAMPDPSRKQIEAYLYRVYERFAGATEGVEQLLARAQRQASPPTDLHIRSRAERDAERERRDRAANPQLWTFLDLKSALIGPEGPSIWTDLRQKLSPKMRLRLVRAEPPARPHTLWLAPERSGPPEIELRLEHRLRSAPARGSWTTFWGTAVELKTSPFLLTLDHGAVDGP